MKQRVPKVTRGLGRCGLEGTAYGELGKKELCWSLQRTIERSQLHCVEGGTKTTEMVGVSAALVAAGQGVGAICRTVITIPTILKATV